MNRHRHAVGALLLLSGLAIALPSSHADAAQGKSGKSHPQKHEEQKGHADKKAKAVVVNHPGNAALVIDRDGHIRLIREYGHAGSLPPGLAKRQALPPGLREQLRENGALPPGLQKYWVPVPAPLVVRLPAVPQYHQRYFVGDDLVVVNTRTNQVIAVIRNVW